MRDHFLDPYPKGWANQQEVRASAALPGAGAWETTDPQLCAYVRHLNLHFTYTRGGAAGAFDWQLEVSPYSVAALVPAGAEEWLTESIYAAGAVAAGADTQSDVQREYQTYTATGAAAEDFVFGPIHFASNVERYRLRVRESGNLGNPGTLQIEGHLFT